MNRRQEDLLHQLAYFVDELEAQRIVLGLIPEGLWDSRPPGDALTLREMYARMLDAEAHSHREDLGLARFDRPALEAPSALLEAIARIRKQTISDLKDAGELPESAAFAITQADTDRLRQIGLRLNETSMGGPRVRNL